MKGVGVIHQGGIILDWTQHRLNKHLRTQAIATQAKGVKQSK